ncbi:hypothetical protein KEM54_001774, partial [Ascosphaera aggregata]
MSSPSAVLLTRDIVLSALVAAASNSQDKVVAATRQLESWQRQPKYHQFLQDAFTDYSLPLAVRHLAIIQLKNGIDRYWRKSAPYSLPPDLKQMIKTRAVEAGALEPDSRLALQNALLVAKIVRNEFPADWPDAISNLLQLLRASTQPGSSPLQLPRVLLMILRVIKELSTVRLLKAQRALIAIAPEMLHVISSIYVQKVNEGMSLLETTGQDPSAALGCLEVSHLSLKSMRRLAVAAFEHPNRDSGIQATWSLILNHFASFYTFTTTHASKLPSEILLQLRKHLLQLSKFHLDMITRHPAAFVLLPDSISLIQSYWRLVVELGQNYGITDISQIGIGADFMDEERTFTEKVGLKALLIVRACVRLAFYPIQTFKYPKPEDKEEKNQAVSTIKTHLLSDEFVVEVMELLVTKFFRFNPSDLEMWQDDPEEWERLEEEISDAWEFSIRPCAEKLFLDLVINFKNLLVPKLIQVFQAYTTLENNDILLKDSIYCAIGLAAPVLEKHLDFNTFLESVLVQETIRQLPGQNILRRRIAIMLAEWVPVKIEQLNMEKIYQIFQHLLSDNGSLNDLVVRLTAARQLKAVLDPFEFDPSVFQAFITPILTSILTLLEQTSLVQTKMGLLETVRVIVVKMEDHISPFTDRIISLLPPLWEQAGEEYLMKQAILTLLASMMHSLKEDSARYHSLILPLIQQSSDPQSDSSGYLLQEALDLWAAIVVQCPSPASPELISLVPCLFKIFDAETDSIRQALEITQSYITLAPREMLMDEIRVSLASCLNNLLNVTAKERLGIVPLLGEQLIRAIDMVDAGNEQALGVLAKTFVETGFLQTILAGLHDAYTANQTTGPNRKTSLIFGVMETDYFSVLARLALASPGVLIESVTLACSGQTQEQAMKWLLTEWFSHFDNIGDVNRKKLHGLALTRLLSVNGNAAVAPTYLLEQLQSYITIWTDLISELADGPDESGGDYLIYWNGKTGNGNEKYDEKEVPETTRQRVWERADPVFRIYFRQYVTEILSGVIEVCGGINVFKNEWL